MRGARIGVGLAFAAHRNSGDGVRNQFLPLGLGDNITAACEAKLLGEGVRDTSVPGTGNRFPSCNTILGLPAQTF